MEILITILYVAVPLIILFGVMFLIRQKREKEYGQQPSNKLTDMKEDTINEKVNN